MIPVSEIPLLQISLQDQTPQSNISSRGAFLLYPPFLPLPSPPSPLLIYPTQHNKTQHNTSPMPEKTRRHGAARREWEFQSNPIQRANGRMSGRESEKVCLFAEGLREGKGKKGKEWEGKGKGKKDMMRRTIKTMIFYFYFLDFPVPVAE